MTAPRPNPALRRWGRAVVAALGTGVAVSLTACATATPGFTPKPVETITPSAPTRTPSSTATSTATSSASQTATATPSPASVKASGSLTMYAEVTKKLTGTCGTKNGASTITLADHANDFYGTVDATIVLKAGKAAVDSVAVAFGEDSEGFTWKLSYDSAKTASGTSAKLASAGNTYTVSGKLKAVETRKGKTIEEVLPFKVVAKCAGAQW
ncbi:MAG: lipoprotein LpqH [Actinobacteria bacterium]|nr:lipoprotein LpqH [Actinomycetota bacterium]